MLGRSHATAPARKKRPARLNPRNHLNANGDSKGPRGNQKDAEEKLRQALYSVLDSLRRRAIPRQRYPPSAFFVDLPAAWPRTEDSSTRRSYSDALSESARKFSDALKTRIPEDALKVWRQITYHHGIYVGPDEIVDFGPHGVRKCCIDDFVDDNGWLLLCIIRRKS